MPEVVFDPEAILRSLAEHEVAFVVIGGIAAALHGSDHVTTDIDVTPRADVENLDRLSLALVDLDARIRVEGTPEGLPFAHDGRSLAAGRVWNLVTRHGDLDLSLVPSGTEGYEDLRGSAIVVELGGVPTAVASLDDIIRSKEAADRPKDRLALPALRHLRDAGRADPG